MKKSLLTILCTLLSVFSWAQGTTAGDEGGSAEAYAVLSEGNTMLTFYYDANKSSHSGAMSVGPFYSSSDQAWIDQNESITSVVFDDSFANCTTLTSTAF